VDKLLNDARQQPDVATRKPLYDAAAKVLADDDSIVYLYTQPWPFVLSKKVVGFKGYPDGLIRLRDVNLKD